IISSAERVTLRVFARTAGLDEGIHTTTVRFSFSDGSVQQATVVLILKAGATRTQAPSKAGHSANCSPAQQVMVTTSLGNNFNGAAGWPVMLRAEVYDDCGTPLTDSSVTATFSSNDAPKTFTNLRNGQYVATWTPRASVDNVTITMEAKNPILPAVT